MFGDESLRYAFVNVLTLECLSHGVEVPMIPCCVLAIVHSYFGMLQLKIVSLRLNLFNKNARVFCFYL